MNAPMQGQYRGYPQAAQRSPAAPRRGPGPIMSGPHAQGPPNPQLLARGNAAAMETELAKRRSRKPTDKNIPEGIEDAIIGDGVHQYKSLREVERRLDSAMMRKRLDIQDSVNRNVKRYKTLRIWISNTAEGQPWQAQEMDENAYDFSSENEAIYRVKIEGRLLDDDQADSTAEDSDDDEDGNQDGAEKDGDAMDHDGAATDKPAVPGTLPRKRLSHFFKSITIEFDRSKSLQPEKHAQIEWKKPALPPNITILPSSADFDSLEYERQSDENLNVTISLVRDENPERFKLSRELQEVLDTEEEDRAGTVMGIWEYVKALGLQQDEEKRAIQCDDRLKAIFKADTIFFPQIPDRIVPHISPLPPIKLPYTIRVDPEYQANPTPTIYDIRVPIDDPLRAKMLALTTNPTYPATLRQIASLDDQLALIVQALAHSKAKHTFYSHMSKDPANFVKRWMSSQRRDLEVILGEATIGGGEDGRGEEFRRGGSSGVWGTPVVNEAVRYMLAKPEVSMTR